MIFKLIIGYIYNTGEFAPRHMKNLVTHDFQWVENNRGGWTGKRGISRVYQCSKCGRKMSFSMKGVVKKMHSGQSIAIDVPVTCSGQKIHNLFFGDIDTEADEFIILSAEPAPVSDAYTHIDELEPEDNE